MILVVGDVVDDIGVRPLGTVNPAERHGLERSG